MSSRQVIVQWGHRRTDGHCPYSSVPICCLDLLLASPVACLFLNFRLTNLRLARIWRNFSNSIWKGARIGRLLTGRILRADCGVSKPCSETFLAPDPQNQRVGEYHCTIA